MIDCERYWSNLQKMQCKTSTNVLLFGMFISSTLEASVFMEKNYSDNLNSINNRGKDLTWKQMFEISEQLTLEQSDEIFGLSQISWENSSWKPLSLANDAEVISLSRAQVFVSSDSVLCLGKVSQNPASNTVCGRTVELVRRFTTIQNFGHNWRRADGIRVEYFPRIHHFAARRQSPRVLVQKSEKPENLQDGSSSHDLNGRGNWKTKAR